MRYNIITVDNKNAITDSQSAYYITEARRLAIEASQKKRYAAITINESIISHYKNGIEMDLMDEIILQ